MLAFIMFKRRINSELGFLERLTGSLYGGDVNGWFEIWKVNGFTTNFPETTAHRRRAAHVRTVLASPADDVSSPLSRPVRFW